MYYDWTKGALRIHVSSHACDWIALVFVNKL